jgi:hypothetical protein
MLTHRATRRFKAAGTLAISLGLMLLLVAPANAAAPTLTASLSANGVINGPANAGADTPFSLSVSSNQGTLQSLRLAAPDGFFVDLTSVALSAGSLASTSTTSRIDVSGLKISGSAVLTVSFDAYPACTPRTYEPPPSTNGWNLTAFQKGGTAYAPQSFSTRVTTPSACQLLFDDPIATQGSIPGSTTAVVRATRENGTTDSTFAGAISLSIEMDPGSNDAFLITQVITYTGGVATFSVSLDRSGNGYVLEACSPTISVTCSPGLEDGQGFLSGSFAVYNSSFSCHPNPQVPCSVAAPGLEVSTQVSASNQNATIRAGVWDVDQPPHPNPLANLDCPGYDELTHSVASFDFTGTGEKIVVNTISAEVMREVADQGVSHLQACFGSSIQFTDRSGQPAERVVELGGLYVGLLPDCPAGLNPAPFAPCVISRQGGGQGTGLFTYIAEHLDPGGSRH